MPNPNPTQASQHLIALAKRSAEIYKTLPRLRALLYKTLWPMFGLLFLG